MAFSRHEAAAYIADMTLQMRNMARDADLQFLNYLLEMAFQEAFMQSEKGSPESPEKTE